MMKSAIIGVTVIGIYVFVLWYLVKIEKHQEQNYVHWDLKTITAGDYTVEFDIHDS
jgi:hypothetical protein